MVSVMDRILVLTVAVPTTYASPSFRSAGFRTRTLQHSWLDKLQRHQLRLTNWFAQHFHECGRICCSVHARARLFERASFGNIQILVPARSLHYGILSMELMTHTISPAL